MLTASDLGRLRALAIQMMKSGRLMQVDPVVVLELVEAEETRRQALRQAKMDSEMRQAEADSTMMAADSARDAEERATVAVRLVRKNDKKVVGHEQGTVAGGGGGLVGGGARVDDAGGQSGAGRAE